jgi:hypothetical protein
MPTKKKRKTAEQKRADEALERVTRQMIKEGFPFKWKPIKWWCVTLWDKEGNSDMGLGSFRTKREAKAKALEELTAHPDMATADIVQATEVSPDNLVSSDSQLDNQETYALRDGKLEIEY